MAVYTYKTIMQNFFIADKNNLDIISDYIEKGEFKIARDLIYVEELEYGQSTFTIRLSTRISRIEILGK